MNQPASSLPTGARRIGVLGGAFDPPHAAHVALARSALTELHLDELRVVPTGQAWHKQRTLSAAQHRLAMTQLAFSDMPRVVVDPCEIRRAGPSYTVDTLRELKSRAGNTELFLILGSDQARALPGWHAWHEVLQLATICVAERHDPIDAKSCFVAPPGLQLRFLRLHLPAMSVSATDIRNRIAARQGLAPLVFDSVARYIDLHHLYQKT